MLSDPNVMQWVLGTAGLAVLAVLARIFADIQKGNRDNQEQIFNQFQDIIKEDRVANKDTALLVAKTVGMEITSALKSGQDMSQNQMRSVESRLVELKNEIKERYEKHHVFTQAEFLELKNKVDLVLLSISPNPAITAGVKIENHLNKTEKVD